MDVVVLVVVVVNRVVEVEDEGLVVVVVGGGIVVVGGVMVVVVVVAPLRSADSRATKPSGLPPFAACAPPAVPGKSVENVYPATYTSPVVGWIARSPPLSSPLPPRYVA